jgi:iron complex outermembrane receptor protein
VGAYNRMNVPVSYRRGIELELNVNLGKYVSLGGNLALSQNKIEKFVEYLDSANADYSVIYAQHKTEYKNTDISFSPNVVSAAIVTLKPVKGLEIAFINKYVGRQFLDNTGNVKRSINPYNVTNIRFNYTIRTRLIPEISFMLSVYNVLNTEYETNGYTYGAYYDSAQRYDSNFLAPAAPTNFLGGVSLKF